MPPDSSAERPVPSPQNPQQLQQIPVDTSSLDTIYANFARVTSLPEELVLDFGMNTQVTQAPTEALKLTHRLVLNYYTAKRLLGALHMAVQQHESMYGVLEVDIGKRARSVPRPGMPRT
jgi:Protein of unknown function (DUF3467)